MLAVASMGWLDRAFLREDLILDRALSRQSRPWSARGRLCSLLPMGAPLGGFGKRRGQVRQATSFVGERILGPGRRIIDQQPLHQPCLLHVSESLRQGARCHSVKLCLESVESPSGTHYCMNDRQRPFLPGDLRDPQSFDSSHQGGARRGYLSTRSRQQILGPHRVPVARIATHQARLDQCGERSLKRAPASSQPLLKSYELGLVTTDSKGCERRDAPSEVKKSGKAMGRRLAFRQLY